MGLYISATIDAQNKMKSNISSYQPKGRVRNRIAQVMKDYQDADTIRTRSYEEFNNRDLITYMNDCQRAFNSYIPEPSADPDQAWRANTIRPSTRNKCISIAAHVTSAVLYPNVRAQNLDDDEDRDAATVMKDMMDFSFKDSKYEKMFIYAVISALYNPVVIIEEGFSEVIRKIKRIKENGDWEEEEIIDEVFSGFQNHLIPPDELFIGNVYENDVQKQPFIIRRRIVDYNSAKMEYGDNENFKKYVQEGVKFLYADTHDVFYEAYDDDLEGRLVEVVTYWNRFDDLELTFVNGVLLDDPDQPMRRLDKNYPLSTGGYEPVDEGKFFYYKSLVDKLGPDQGIIDVLYNLAIDAAFLQAMPPAVIFGEEEIDSSVIVPGKMTPLNRDSSFMPLNSGANMNAAMNMLQKMESSLAESSAGELAGGQSPVGGTPTAFQISTMQQNAMRVMGLFGKMLKFMVEDFGKLRLNSVLQYMTVGEAVQTMSGFSQMKFRNVLVDKNVERGRKKSKKIDFTMEMPETEEQELEMSFNLLKQEKEKDMEIAKVNPSLFRKLKYTAIVEADMLFSNSETVRKAMNLEAYDRLIQNPHADSEAVTRDFLLGNYRPGEEDKYLKTPEDMQPQGAEGQEAEGQGNATKLTGLIMKQAGARQPVV
jgi:hypothetical protein